VAPFQGTNTLAYFGWNEFDEENKFYCFDQQFSDNPKFKIVSSWADPIGIFCIRNVVVQNKNKFIIEDQFLKT
jgi:hypothetical protein